jgi:DNA modification methylase
MNIDLFGNPVIEKYNLKSDFIIPPFSILDTASGDWQNRKEKWKSLGIKSEVGRGNNNNNQRMTSDGKRIGSKSKKTSTIRLESTGKDITKKPYISIFDPVLCEIMYKWFVPKNGSILDPFAGGSVRGIVANYLDYNYTGIDLRDEQISSNMGQAMEIIPTNPPIYHVGDSNKTMNTIDRKYDFIFTCPPYYDLEVYSDYEGDLSNMTHEHFNNTYESIIKKSCLLLKDNRYACFVVGNVRDKHGYMRDLVGLTIRCFEKHGLKFYNDIILKQPVASASMRAKSNMKYKKIVKIHQNVLVFCKGNPKR